ncbi:MAG: NUDIX domain-containing protein [Nanoarchaeota archaeon]
MGEINWKDKCWVTVIYLIRKDGRVLLHWNKNMDTWIPIGGHIDFGETPEEAIKREVAEETGIDFDFFPETEILGNSRIVKPFKIQMDAVPHHNLHMTFVFVGKCKPHDNRETTDENEKLKWFSEKEIRDMKDEMLISVWDASLKAINLVKNNL